MTRAGIVGITPFFIVQNVAEAFGFYCDQLGFEVTYRIPGDDLIFGIVRRGGRRDHVQWCRGRSTPKLQAGPGSALGRVCPPA
jgi:catechol 2,3-dioxygenase-like lactoylglutathione lyase family enzyme